MTVATGGRRPAPSFKTAPPRRPVRRAELEARLESVPDFPTPQATLEQYRTPAPVAAHLLTIAAEDGCIEGRRVVDLGCGTGILAIGAALLGADVTGVDVDPESLEVAQETAWSLGLDVRWQASDLAAWTPDEPFDAAVMNPPFGAQDAGADRVFYTRARDAVAAREGTAWFLAQPKTERFLGAFARGLDATLERVAVWDYPIEQRFWFHDRDVKTLPIGGYRMGWD